METDTGGRPSPRDIASQIKMMTAKICHDVKAAICLAVHSEVCSG